jgi:hypothetical protein
VCVCVCVCGADMSAPALCLLECVVWLRVHMGVFACTQVCFVHVRSHEYVGQQFL